MFATYIASSTDWSDGTMTFDKTTMAIFYVGLLFGIPLAAAAICLKLAQHAVLSAYRRLRLRLSDITAAAPVLGKPSGSGARNVQS